MDESGGQRFASPAALHDECALSRELADAGQPDTAGLSLHQTEPAAPPARECKQQFVVIAP